MNTRDKFDIDFLKSLRSTGSERFVIKKAESVSHPGGIAPPVVVGSGSNQDFVTVATRGVAREFSYRDFQAILERAFARRLVPEARRTVDETIRGLLRIRDFLGLQLDHAWGNVSDEDFEQRAQQYLADKEKGDAATLRSKLTVLYWYLSTPLDSETVADIFNCRLEDAEKTLEGMRPHVLESTGLSLSGKKE